MVTMRFLEEFDYACKKKMNQAIKVLLLLLASLKLIFASLFFTIHKLIK